MVIGAGGHAAVLIEILLQLDHIIIGLVAKDKPIESTIFSNIPYYDSDDDILSFNKGDVMLVNGIGSLPGFDVRARIHQKFKYHGYQFLSVISPRAMVSGYARLDEGVQIMPGAIVNTNSVIGASTIVNSGAIIEHDCLIGAHNHIAPGATLSGGVITGEHVHVGTGANIIQGIHIGASAVVGAGATVTKNLECNKTLYVARPFLL